MAKTKIDVEQLPEIQGLRAIGRLVFKGFFDDSVQYSSLLKCDNYDPEKSFMVQECERTVSGEPNLKKMCPSCRMKYFLRCADWAFAQHVTARVKALSE